MLSRLPVLMKLLARAKVLPRLMLFVRLRGPLAESVVLREALLKSLSALILMMNLCPRSMGSLRLLEALV